MTRTNTAQYLLHGILYGKVVSSTFCKSLAFTMLKKYCCLLLAATKLGQGNIFTSMCQEFCPRGWGREGCLPQCMLGYTPPEQTHHPPEQTPLDQADPTSPREQTPPRTRQTPLGAATIPPGPGRPPQEQTPPPREADSSIRSTSGQYASYWNAFLLNLTSLTK